MRAVRSVMSGARALTLLAALVALLAFLPWASWLGFAGPEGSRVYLTTLLEWALWSLAIIASAVIIATLFRARLAGDLERARERTLKVSGVVFALVGASVVLLATVLLSHVMFARNPHHVDSVAQLFQARIFSGGHLTAPLPDGFEFFAATHLVHHGGRWFSQYPPGHPALLLVGLLFGVPWLVNPAFAAGTAFLIYLTGRRLLGEGGARLSVLLYAVSPFALFVGASYMNHATTGFFLTLALYAAVRAVQAKGFRWPALVGAALGAAATIRPLESVAWAVVLGLFMLSRRSWRPAAAAGWVCILSLVPLLTYNTLTAGHPLRFGYTLLWGPEHFLGFHLDPWGEAFTPLKSFALTALDFQRLNAALFGWPLPSLLFALIALAWAGADRSSLRRETLLAGLLMAAPIAYFFYWHRDNYLGPRFLHPSLVPAIFLTTVGIMALDRRLLRWRSAFRIALGLTIAISLAINLPNSVGIFAGQEPELKLHPERAVARSGAKDPIVLIKVGWGSRLIARAWALGVTATEAERAYRAIDGCRLQHALDETDSLLAAGVDGALAVGQLRERLSAWRQMNLPVQRGLLPDRSVRVDTTRALSDRCLDEVQRDGAGFTLYSPHVWRNDPWLQRGTIYARSLGRERDAWLRQRYPQRLFLLYAPLTPERGAVPVLRRLEPEVSPRSSPSQASVVEEGR